MTEGRLTKGDLDQLPAPYIIEPLDYEQILSECKADLQTILDQEHSRLGVDVQSLPESDSISKILEILAYRELHARQQINESVRACMLAKSQGQDLQTLASLLLGSAQEQDDNALRARVLAEYDAYHTIGSHAAYAHFAKSVAPDHISDVSILSQQGMVQVVLLPHEADLADQSTRAEERQELLAAVESQLMQDHIRPIGHWVTVHIAKLKRYAIKARVGVRNMPGSREVLTAARTAVRQYMNECYRIGNPVLVSGLLAAIYQPGIKYVILDKPHGDIQVEVDTAAYCPETETDFLIDINAEVPDEKVKELVLNNEDRSMTHLTGDLTITPPDHEVRLTHYAIYWGDRDKQRLEGHASIVMLRVGSSRAYTFRNVQIPEEAIYLLAFTANENGEMAEGVSTPIASRDR